MILVSDADLQTYNKLKEVLKSPGLKVFHQNFNGLYFKIDILWILLQETLKDIHIFGITESHLNESIEDKELHIAGYDIVRNDGKQGSGSGVCAYIRNDLSWQRRPDLEYSKIEAIWIEIFIPKSRPILICFMYRPPDTSRYLNQDFDTLFSDVMYVSIAENKELVLAGDLNCDYMKPSNNKALKNVIEE